jgi:regulator of protease activity HflC (stomatin/prohibitin superfamily)
MGNTCGTLNVHESAVITTWTDKEMRHGPSSCFCYNPCTHSVDKVAITTLKVHQYAVVEDQRDPSKSKYIYGPCIYRLEHPYQSVGPVLNAEVLDQNDYVIVTERNGNKRVETGPKVVQKVFGESYSKVLEAINIAINQYIVLLDKANNATPIRHIRGPAKVYPTPYEEVVPDESNRQNVRPCIQIDANNAIWLKQPDGQVLLVEQPQFYMPNVGEKVERIVQKTLLKESEFCIIITPSGQSVLKMGSNANQRSFFLPPFHKVLPFQMGEKTLEQFHTLPDIIPLSCTIRTSDNVQVKVEMRISFQIFEPELYTKKPVDFYRQISFWVQNELLDAFAQQNFRDFLKHYAASARTVTEASHKTFNEFGIKLLDVQLIHFNCTDAATQSLLDRDIITRVTKQNELLAKEADVEIMKREKEVQMQQMDIEFEKSIKENGMELKRKELDVSLRMKEVDLQIQEEKKRTELMEIKKQNVVKEGAFEGEAQGRAVQAFMAALPSDFTPEQKLGLWTRLRDLEGNAMLYSKVARIEMNTPGTEVKRFDINVEAGAKPFLNQQPMLLPSILGYSGDNGAMSSAGYSGDAATAKSAAQAASSAAKRGPKVSPL